MVKNDNHTMKYTINKEKVLITELGNEGVLFEIETGKYVALNETLFIILKGVEQELNVERIVQNLCDEYAIPEDACRTEVVDALALLAKEKYIV